MTLNMDNVFTVGEESRDEFFNNIADKAVVSYPIDRYITKVDVVNNGAETIAHQITIPANTAINGIHIRSLVAQWLDDNDLYPYTKFRIRVGTTGTTADTIYFYYRMDGGTTADPNSVFFLSEWLDTKVTELNWSVQQIVSITVYHSSADTDIHGIVFSTEVEGF